jgi:hypothetical protein
MPRHKRLTASVVPIVGPRGGERVLSGASDGSTRAVDVSTGKDRECSEIDTYRLESMFRQVAYNLQS